jgi:hypothetical protein
VYQTSTVKLLWVTNSYHPSDNVFIIEIISNFKFILLNFYKEFVLFWIIVRLRDFRIKINSDSRWCTNRKCVQRQIITAPSATREILNLYKLKFVVYFTFLDVQSERWLWVSCSLVHVFCHLYLIINATDILGFDNYFLINFQTNKIFVLFIYTTYFQWIVSTISIQCK